ncbi:MULTISPECIES: ESPR-type extended signal peptide-containing protein [Stenotrophomonas]|uniref:YadA-like family protein n=1 Tax=Stenotrophomonas lactitubi TaxID=2045214 RepID=A0AAW4GD12_9GAMM|nr:MULTISPECIES: ESPR-type extended signal peptide-containing protein [Stenotrophomonas]MBM9912085.1 YadA-like family protein [Stenotrophomonas lactitubi]MBM9920877.1 YadA-like family protein [Stenotrophomonas lactitubi]MBM9937681.1 YadA-like family protein [Stenotrophomonas lactitubi]
MNSIYRIVWNAAIGKWVVASELATGRSKKGGKGAARGLAAVSLLMLALPLWAAEDSGTTCVLVHGQQGMLDAQGVCVAADADGVGSEVPQARTIGVQAAVDDQYVKVNGSGTAATAAGVGAIAIGNNARALADADGNADNAIAMGANASTQGNNAVAIGMGASANSQNAQGAAGSLAVGANANAGGWNSVAVGYNTNASGSGAVAVGRGARGSASEAVAMGDNSSVSAEGGVALGGSSQVSAAGAVAIGRTSVANRENTVSVGSATLRRQVVNVAAGTQANDAVIVQQLRAGVQALGGGADLAANGSITAPSYVLGHGGTHTTVGSALEALDDGLTTTTTTLNQLSTSLDNGTVGLVQQAAAGADLTVGASTDGAAVDFNGTAGARRLRGVADATAADEAVTLAQLQASSTSVADALGGGSVADAQGRIGAPTYTVAGSSYGNVGDALTALDGRVGSTGQDLADLRDALDAGSRYFKADGSGVADEAAATGSGSVAAGASAAASAAQGVAIGWGARAGNGDGAMALGANARATGENSVALGAEAVADRDNVVSVGWGMGGNGTRQVINVANGTAAADAVNVQQLRPVIDGLGGGAAHNASTGTVTGPRYSVQGQTFDNVGDALSSVDGGLTVIDGRVTRNEGDITQLRQQLVELGNGEAGLVQQSAADAAVTIGAGTGGTVVDLRGTDGERQLKGVAAGTDASDAVNLGQLNSAVDDLRATGNRYVRVDGAGDGSDDAQANGLGAMAVGASAQANGAGSVALGQGAMAQADNSVALGAGAVADRANSVSMGAAGAERQITHVADGSEDTDAVNLRQLKAAGLVGDGGQMLDAVTYDAGSQRAQVTFGGANGTVLSNVADGRVGAGSREAVNGGQLAALRDLLQGRIGDLDGRVGALEAGDAGAGSGNPPYYGANPQPGDQAGDNPAQAIGQGSVAAGAGAEARADNSVALGAGSVADRENSVSVGREGGERQITNVAAGVQATDAVNVGQLQQGVHDVKAYADERVQDTWSGLEQRLDQVNRQANRGIAAAAALAPMTPYLPGRTTINANLANYRSETAMGVGVSRWSDNGRVNVNGGASMARGDKPIFRMGVGVVLGD